jgi:hypothetical protein
MVFDRALVLFASLFQALLVVVAVQQHQQQQHWNGRPWVP